MLKFSCRTMVTLSGLVWLAVGCWLLPLGLNFLVQSSKDASNAPFLSFVAPYAGGLENATIVLLSLALFVGYMKGKKVLGKSAEKGTQRLVNFKGDIPITQIYSKAYYFLLGGMIALGMSMKFLGIPLDIRGFVDVAVGSALINGALVYFKNALVLNKTA